MVDATRLNKGAGLFAEHYCADVAQSTTDGELVALVANKQILVLAVVAHVGATATDIVFKSKKSGVASVAISGTFANGANGGFVLPYNDQGWFVTENSGALTCTTGAGTATGLTILYKVV